MPWKNVLVYVDGRPESAAGLNEGLRLAHHAGGQLLALDVVHYLPTRFPSGLLALREVEILALMIEQRREQLQEELEGLMERALLDVKVTHGSPPAEIIKQAVHGRHDLVVKSARGRDASHSTSFGSIGLHLVRKCPVPVLLLQPGPSALREPKVLCAVELDHDHGTGRQELNRSLLKAAHELSLLHQCDLHVVHVVDSRRTGAYRAFLSDDAFGQFDKHRHELLTNDLDALLTSALPSTARAHAHVPKGDAADEIVKLVLSGRFSHLVMGSVAQRSAGHFMGSLAEDVFSRVDCSILTLKPDGFQSPIPAGIFAAA